jgi:hypothetical protein
MTCCIEGCLGAVYSKGMCRKHYTAAWRNRKGSNYYEQSRAYMKKWRKDRLLQLSPAERQEKNKQHAAYSRAWRAAHAERLRENEGYGQRYLRRYRLTAADYDKLLSEQGGRCAICGALPAGKRLAVDHDHNTGQVRGLLCSRCNFGIGFLGDSSANCRSAAGYLDFYA